MIKEWLTELMTLEDVERENLVNDSRLGPDAIPFGFMNDEWEALKENIQPGDELWEFSSPPESWRELAGRAGIALVRDGEIINCIITAFN